jgi:hypothetical protein
MMPSFKGQVSEEEILELVTFLKGLRRGQTPPRVEDADPPAINRGNGPGTIPGLKTRTEK